MDADNKSREAQIEQSRALSVMIEIATTALRTGILAVMLRLPRWAAIVIAHALGERRVVWLAVRLPRAGVVSVLDRLSGPHLISGTIRASVSHLLDLAVRLPPQSTVSLMRRFPDGSLHEIIDRISREDLSSLSEPVPLEVASAAAERLSDEELVRTIQRIAAPRTLDVFPGWKIGSLEETSDALVGFRRQLWLALQERRIEQPFVVDWLGDNKIWAYPGNDSSRSVVVEGCYEPNELLFLDSVLEPGMTFVDIGAHVGLYTLYASSRVRRTGKVISIEPGERDYARLLANIRLSHSENISPVKAAITDRVGKGDLKVAAAEYAGHSTLGSFSSDAVSLDHTEVVRTTTLDELSPRFGRVDVVKIDVEGAEYAVLRGAEATLRTWHPIVLFELFDAALHGQDASERDVLEFLQSLSYELYLFGRLSGRLVPLHNINGPYSSNLVAMFR